jgi:hypothetical protein
MDDDRSQPSFAKDVQEHAIALLKANPKISPAAATQIADTAVSETRAASYRGYTWWTLHRGNLLLMWSAWVACFGLAILTLPRWWNLYVHAQWLHTALRVGDDNQTFDLPQISYLTGMVRLLLPRSSDTPDVRELDTPFLQQHVKELLRVCLDPWPDSRVLVLIDDVDVMPSSDFHELFRLLRPLSKVPGVCCIVCVPMFFYHVLHGEELGDMHSTISECYVLGNPKLYGPFPRFELKLKDASKSPDEKVEEFAAMLPHLFLSRLRFRTAGSEGADEFGKTKAFGFLRSQWERALKTPAGHVENAIAYLDRIGASRRELLRETKRLLDDLDRSAFSEQADAIRLASQSLLDEMRADYCRAEYALNANVVERHAREAAIAGLQPAQAPVPPAPVAPVPAATPAAGRPNPQPGDVWVNPNSGRYFLSNSPYYGNTQTGGYMTETEAIAAGYRRSRR